MALQQMADHTVIVIGADGPAGARQNLSPSCGDL